MTRPSTNRRSFDRRRFLVALAGAPALAAVLAACGDPDTVPADPVPGDTAPGDTAPGDTAPSVTSSPDVTASSVPVSAVPGGGTTAPPATGPVPTTIAPALEHPTGADDVVVRIAFEGGFVPQDVNFQHVPTLLISGDGRLFEQGAQTMIYPGPLLPAIMVSTISEAALQRLLVAADEHGLLTDPVPSYDADMSVADAPDTVVELHATRATFRHAAYALGMSGEQGAPESSPARVQLLDFTRSSEEMLVLRGSDFGDPAPFQASAFRIRAQAVTLADFAGQDVEPTVNPWPAETGRRLADAAECALATGPVVADVLAKANTLSLFTEDGLTYQLSAVAQLPGDTC
jgi:hypothetical protein